MRYALRASLLVSALLLGVLGNAFLISSIQASEDGGSSTLGFVSASNGLPAGESHHAIWFGDINNDTNLDIATAGYFGVRVWTGDGAGTWTLAANGLPASGYDGGVCLGDINNDGNLDVAATNYDDGPKGVSVWIGDGAGSWTPASSGLPTTMWYTGVFLADVNHDDNLDLAVANEVGGVYVFLGNGAGVWTEASENLPDSGGYYGIWMADVNHDGNTDLAVAGVGMHVYLGNGAGNWTEASNGLPWTDQWNSVALGDLNLDGNIDIIAAMDQSGHGLRAWLGDGTSNWTLASSGLPITGTYYGITLADLVGDKYPDILAGNFDGSGIEIWKGDGGYSWTDASAGLPSGKVIGVAAGDIDNDGYVDIGAAGENFGVQVWRNDETTPPLKVEVLQPNGGEVWNSLAMYEINWTASGGTPPLIVKLEYSVDGLFGSYTLISDGEANDGTFTWTVPNTPSVDCFVRVNVTDSALRTNWDKSNSSFTIVGTDTSPPTITNLQPANLSIISDATPAIGANYSDPSGIDTSSVILRVDGANVTAQATVTSAGVSYTPSAPLLGGLHDVYLEIEDNAPAQNKATAAWSFEVDTDPPTISNLEPFEIEISDSAPTIRATYDDPSGIDTSSVRMKVDGADVTASATVTAFDVSYTPAPLSDGIHLVYVEVKDQATPQNAVNLSWWFVVDTVAPTIANLRPANQSATGDSTPLIGASYSDDSSVVPGGVVILVGGANVTASAIITPLDVEYTPPAPLAEGAHSVRVEAGDDAIPSNRATVVWYFTVDTQPPVISDLQPTNGSIIGDATPAISASYVDPSGINITTVVLKVDSVDVTTQATVEFDRVTYVVPSPMADGLHDVYVEVHDNSSPANSAKRTWSFTVDTTIIDPDPPVITDLQPVDQSIIGVNAPTIGASYTDVSGIDTASVILRVDGFDVTAQATVTPLDVTYSPSSPLSEGSHSVYLEVADDSPSQNIATAIWSFTVDTVAPVTSGLQPTDQSIISDDMPMIGASYSDDSGIDLASVVLKVDSIDVTASATVGANQVAYSPISLSEGIHDVYLEVGDQATPQNVATSAWWFTVDTLPPMITNMQPAPMSTIADDKPTIGASFNDPSGIDILSVAVVLDSMDVTASAVVTSGGFTYVPASPVSNGGHTVHVQVGDNSAPRNVIEAQWAFTVDTTMLDLTPPVISDLQPVDQTIIGDSTPVIQASYVDDSGIDESSVILMLDSMDISSLAAVTSSGVIYTPIAPLSEGSHSVYLEVEDDSSNRNKAVEAWSFTVDATSPVISNLEPVDQTRTGDSTPTIGAGYSDDSGVDIASVMLRVDSMDITTSATIEASGISYTPSSPLSEGIHDIYLEVRDQSSPQNVATRSWQFTVDTLPPVIGNLMPTNESVISYSRPTISATYSDPSGIDVANVTLKLGSMDVTGSAVVTESAITLTFITPLADGTYTVYLAVGDPVSPPNRAVVVWSFTIAAEQEDTDHDGLPDDWERDNFGDLSTGPDDDVDSDGLGNSQEYLLGTDPNDADTDNDGIGDGDDPNPLVAEEEGDAFAEGWFWAAVAALLAVIVLLLLLFWRREPREEDTENKTPELDE
ncbi:MAG: FG-GAP-like repeat-containing protein [Thermoplasmata archaeon]